MRTPVLQIYVIALMAVVVVRDSVQIPGEAAPFSPWRMIAALVMFGMIAASVQFVCWACGRGIDRRGDGHNITESERFLLWSRPLTVLAHAVAVFALGWLGQVRSIVGDTIALDELISLVPSLATIALGWWSFYPIERRIREATLIRTIDEGQPIYQPPSRGAFVWSHVRHDLMLMLVPLSLVAAWSEIVERGFSQLLAARNLGNTTWLGHTAHWLEQHGSLELARTGVQLLGVAVVFTIAPLLLRLVWDTVRLGDGPLRDDLLGLCKRAGIRVREVLVWRTHGTLINGAALGVLPALRYILLTDALLDRLPERQVHAVMAHEIAHVKHRHIPWLIASMFAAAGFAALGGGLLLQLGDWLLMHALHGREHANPDSPPAWLVAWTLGSEAATTLGSLVVMVVAFGWVSRRFEWQADAFAARQLSAEHGSETVTPQAAAAMAEALASVARLNHVPLNRKGFRHGSIALRIRKLEMLIGQPLNRLRCDRTARRIKQFAAAGVVLIVGLSAWDAWTAAKSTPRTPRDTRPTHANVETHR